MTRATLWRCALLACGMLTPFASPAQDAPLELRVKLALLVNFARYVSWPADKLPAGDSPIELCILGEDAWDDAIAQAATNRQVGAHPLTLTRVRDARALGRCHVAYVEDPAVAGTVLAATEGRRVLTVYEGDHTQTQGIVRLYVEDRHIRFEVNLAQAGREKLNVAARLLDLGHVVYQ